MGKIRTDVPAAAKMFTDREEPKAVFDRALDERRNHMGEDGYGVINYYGIGGIGKSRLEDELGRQLGKSLAHVKIDFEAYGSMNKITVLRAFAKLLYDLDSKRFAFRGFRCALQCYAERTGEPMGKIGDTSSFLEGNPVADVIVGIASITPVLSTIAGVVSALDKGVTELRNLYEERQLKETLSQLEGFEADEIVKHLETFFYRDLDASMRKDPDKGPLVIFLDTYEAFTDEMRRNRADLLGGESWLLEVVAHVPDVLWVIAGRERLSWADEFEVEGHLLGDLSQADTSRFLKSAGVDERLFGELYQLTGGTPVFLDLCVDRYMELCAASKDGGATILAADLGTSTAELVERYAKYMESNVRHLAYLLACLGKWTDNLAEQVALQSRFVNFLKPEYDALMKHSFITKVADERSYMHDIVRTVFLDDMEPEFKAEVNRLAFDYHLERYAQLKGPDAIDCVRGALRAFAQEPGLVSHEVYEQHFDKLDSLIFGLYDAGQPWAELELCMNLISSLPGTQDDAFYAGLAQKAYETASQAFYLEGMYEEAIGAAKHAYESAQTLYGDNDDVTLSSYLTLGHLYSQTGHHREAREILEDACARYRERAGMYALGTFNADLTLALARRKMGDLEGSKTLLEWLYANSAKFEEHSAESGERLLDADEQSLGLDVIIALDLATVYDEMGDHERALDLKKRTFAKLMDENGANSPMAANMIVSIANTLDDMGELAEALELHKKAFDKLTTIQGDDSPTVFEQLHRIANVSMEMEDYASAESYIDTWYEHRLKAYGQDDVRTLEALTETVVVRIWNGDYTAALPPAKRCLDLCEEHLGENHPYTLDSLMNLGYVFEMLGDQTNADMYNSECVRRKAALGMDVEDSCSA